MIGGGQREKRCSPEAGQELTQSGAHVHPEWGSSSLDVGPELSKARPREQRPHPEGCGGEWMCRGPKFTGDVKRWENKRKIDPRMPRASC